MLPVINLGIFRIPAYTLFVFIGVIAFTITTIIILEKIEKGEQKITNSLLVISIFGFIVLVLAAFILNSFFHSIEKKKIVLGGITWLGGVIVSFPAMIYFIHKFCRKAKAQPLRYFNFLIPGIVLAHGFGRIGCFLGGCCYGSVNEIFGIVFPKGSLAALQYPSSTGGSLPVFPTQLVEACFEFLLFACMLIFYKKAKDNFFEIYAFSYGTFRFLLEFLRGDNRGGYIFFLSPSQIMSLILIAYGLVVILYKKGIVLKKLRAKMQEIAVKQRKPQEDGQAILTLIRELKKMQEDGILTQEEFEERKVELLKRL